MAAESGAGQHLRLVETIEGVDELPAVASVGDYWQRLVAEDGQLPRHVLEVVDNTTIRWHGRQTELTPDMTRTLNLFLKNEGKPVEQRQLAELLPEAEEPLMGALRLHDYVGATAVSWYRRRSAKDWPRNLWGLNPDLTVVDRRLVIAEKVTRQAAIEPVNSPQVTAERVELLISPNHRRVMAIDDNRAYGTIQDKADALGMSPRVFRDSLRRASRAAAAITDAVANGTFDYVQWGDHGGNGAGGREFPFMERQNCLTYLAKVGLPIADNARTAELQSMAGDHLEGAMTLSADEKAWIRHVYKLTVDDSRSAKPGQGADDRGSRAAYLAVCRIMDRINAPATGVQEQLVLDWDTIRDALRNRQMRVNGGGQAASAYAAAMLDRQTVADKELRLAVGSDMFDAAAHTVARCVIRYSSQFQQPIEGNIERDMGMLRQLLADVRSLEGYGFKKVLSVAIYSSPLEIARLRTEYAGLSDKLFAHIIEDAPVDPREGLADYDVRLAEATARFKDHPVINETEVRTFASLYKRASLIPALERYADNVVAVRQAFPGEPCLSDAVLRDYCSRFPGGAQTAIVGWLQRRSALLTKFAGVPDVGPGLIGRIAQYGPSKKGISQDEHVSELAAKISQYKRELAQVRLAYKTNPDLDNQTMVSLVQRRLDHAADTVERYLTTLEGLRNHYKGAEGVEDFALRFIARNFTAKRIARHCDLEAPATADPKAIAAVERWIRRCTELQSIYRNNLAASDSVIKEVALRWPISHAAGLGIVLYRRSIAATDSLHRNIGDTDLPLHGVFADRAQQPEVAIVGDEVVDSQRAVLQDAMSVLSEAERLAVMLVFGIEDIDSLGFGEDDLRRLLVDLGADSLPEYVQRVALPKLQQAGQVM